MDACFYQRYSKQIASLEFLGMFLAVFYELVRRNILSVQTASLEFLEGSLIIAKQNTPFFDCMISIAPPNISINAKPFMDIRMGALADT